MYMLKRILPFALTLLLGLLLGGFVNPFYGTRHEEKTKAMLVFSGVDGHRGGCPSRMLDRTSSFVRFKPLARYTDEARRHATTGIVRLHLKVNADGTVSDVMPLNTLPYGLTEAAVDAAKRIEFSPATLYGQPISEIRDDITFEFPLN